MGFKVEHFVESVDENLFCSICHEVFEDPVSCKDGHTFCKVCIKKWLNANRTCPLLDKGYLAKRNLVPQLTVKGIIDNLEVYCEPHTQDKLIEVQEFEEKCDWVGKLQSLRQHRDTCPFQEVRCSHAQCILTMQRRELEHHKEICEFRRVKCEKCEMVLLQHDKEKHIKDDCLQAMICCPNQCGDEENQFVEQMKRVDLDNHIKNICPKTLVFCPFKDQGCSVKVERQHVDEHVQDNMAAHMMLLAKQCSLLTEQNSLLTEKNTTLTEETTTLTEEFSILAEEFSELNLRCFHLVEKNSLLQEELRQVKETCSYTWTINEFPTLSTKHRNGSAFTSPIFWLLGHSFSLLVYPNGLHKGAEGCLSLYLDVTEEYPKSRRLLSNLSHITNAKTVKCRLSMKSVEDHGIHDISRELTHVFKEPGRWGWDDFIETTEALTYCSSTNGSLTIQCTIQLDKPQ